MEKINYFIYARKSTEPEGRQVLSIPSQLQDLEQLAQREHLTVIDTITESRSAATPFNRPAYADMIKRIKKGNAAGIIVWHIDRLGRNHLEFGELKYLLQTGIIKSIWTLSREYKSADNGLLISLEASVATEYSIELAKKVKWGLEKKCALGQPPKVALLGYLNTKFQEHGSNAIIEDPDRWHIIRKGFDLLLSRQYTVPQIADILNNEYNLRTRPSKTKPARPLHKSVLYRMFTNPFYSGYFYYKSILFKGSYTPMISVAEYDEIQIMLGRNNRPRPQKHQFAFTGLMTCGICGCAITASQKTKLIKATGEYKAYIFYHCTKRKGICTDKHYSKVEEIETTIEKELTEFHLLPVFKEWAIRILKENNVGEVNKQKAAIKEAAAFQKKIEQELNILIDLRIGNTISEAQYLQKKAEKEGQLIRAKDKIYQLETGNENWLEKLSDKLDFASMAVEKFKSKDINEQKEVCTNFGWNWTLKEKKLLIDKFNWLYSVKKYGKEVEARFGRLEPEKVFEKYGEKRSLEILRPIVRRLRSEVSTKNSIDDEKRRKNVVKEKNTSSLLTDS